MPLKHLYLGIAKTLSATLDDFELACQGHKLDLDLMEHTLGQLGIRDRVEIQVILSEEFLTGQFSSQDGTPSPTKISPQKLKSPTKGVHFTDTQTGSPAKVASKSPSKRPVATNVEDMDDPLLASAEQGQAETFVIPDTLSSSYRQVSPICFQSSFYSKKFRQHYDILFELSKHVITDIRTAAWNVLMSMPTNPDLLSDLKLRDEAVVSRTSTGVEEEGCDPDDIPALIDTSAGAEGVRKRSSSIPSSVGARAVLERYLDVSCVSRVLYTLQIIESMLCPLGARGTWAPEGGEGAVGHRWVRKFVELGGLTRMTNLILDSDFEKGSQCCTRVTCINAAVRITRFVLWGDKHSQSRGLLGKDSSPSLVSVLPLSPLSHSPSQAVDGGDGETTGAATASVSGGESTAKLVFFTSFFYRSLMGVGAGC